MKTTSFAIDIECVCTLVVTTPELHAKWLNTLSFLENCGARMIAACEHPTLVKEEMLKHAAEEFRHAHHLKRQIPKVSAGSLSNYSLDSILGDMSTLHYLSTLNLQTVRFLKQCQLTDDQIRELAYLLVTYAIECRAAELYPIYEKILRQAGSRVTVKSILLEEHEHLAEMERGLARFPMGVQYANVVSEIENVICQKWLNSVHINLLPAPNGAGR